MTFEQIQSFIEITKLGSISNAAKTLHVSQPNISIMLKSLEREIGVKLFNRNSKGMELTTEGAEFHFYALRVLDTLNDIHNIKTTPKQEEITLNISTQFISPGIVAVSEIEKKYNHLKKTITLLQRNFSEVISDLTIGKSRIGLIQYSSNQEKIILPLFERAGLKFVKTTDLIINLSISKNNPLYDKKDIVLSDVYDYPLVYLNITEKDYINDNMVKLLSADSFKSHIRVQDTLYLYHIMDTTNAVSLISSTKEHNLNDLLNLYNMDIRLIPLDCDFNQSLGYLYNASYPLSEYELEFINLYETCLNKPFIHL